MCARYSQNAHSSRESDHERDRILAEKTKDVIERSPSQPLNETPMTDASQRSRCAIQLGFYWTVSISLSEAGQGAWCKECQFLGQAYGIGMALQREKTWRDCDSALWAL